MRTVFSLYSLVLTGLCLVSFSGFAQQPERKSSHELKVSRPAANPVLEGTVVIKALDLKDDSPFLRVKTPNGSFKDYLIKTCDETCKAAINSCKGGEQCSIRGRVDESAPSIMAEFVRVGATAAGAETNGAETKTTKTGHVFTRDASNPRLGEAWRDPSGMIWGDIVKKEDGSPRSMHHREATDYCKSIGAELPSREDFIRLRESMGAESESYAGYTPQVLPNLTYTEHGEIRSGYFWSSSVRPDFSYLAYFFEGRTGIIVENDRHLYAKVRCIDR